MNITTIDKTC